MKIAIMGYGTVGSGVFEIINSENFKHKDIEVKYILDIKKLEGKAAEVLTDNFDDLAGDKEVEVVAEMMGGLHPAYEYTKALLEGGKSVVTSNKELVATYGTELLKTAKKHGVKYNFEASVGGGIPIISVMKNDLGANSIKAIAGILNGTTNYILTEMFENGKDFSEVLKTAQELGYAEKNPAADVEGYDACRKIAILSSLAWGDFVDYNDIPTEGITKITLDDVKYAEKFDSVIKLIGYAEKDGCGRVYASVGPMMIKKGEPIASVRDVFNAVEVSCDMLGEAMFYGKGAGKLPTASAIVADIIDCQNQPKMHNILWGEKKAEMYADKKFRYMIRTKNADFDGLDKACGVVDGENAYITKPMSAKEIAELKNEIEIVSYIKIFDI